jgi:beta-lactamase superfamily II metal-dependent hydrolase
MAGATVEVRMYNVGFGDAFRITVRSGRETWRMLIDCGVHAQGAARPMKDSVKNVIADLAEDCGGTPHLDVVVATHHHRDHIVGFAEDDWAAVEVGEVWVPFVEDSQDDDAKALRQAQSLTAQKLASLIDARQQKLAANQTGAAEVLAAAMAFAMNSQGNAKATDRLLGRNDTKFATEHEVRYLPDKTASKNTIKADKCGAVAHILGPPRNPQMLKKMDPPKGAGWLTLNLDDAVDPDAGDNEEEVWPLFNRTFVVEAHDQVPEPLQAAKKRLRLESLSNDIGLLAAAAILEQSVNNTSLFFVLDVGGLRLLFPGDAQFGAWESVRNDPKSLALIRDVDFYKMGHHGSHNATPMTFIEEQWKKPGDTMVPWGLVKLWEKTIPDQERIKALTATHHRVILPQKVIAGQKPKNELVETEWWTQLTFKVPL